MELKISNLKHIALYEEVMRGKGEWLNTLVLAGGRQKYNIKPDNLEAFLITLSKCGIKLRELSNVTPRSRMVVISRKSKLLIKYVTFLTLTLRDILRKKHLLALRYISFKLHRLLIIYVCLLNVLIRFLINNWVNF